MKLKVKITLEPVLNRVVEKWNEIGEPEQKNEFKSLIQSYVRLYEYISQIITFVDIELEKLFIFLKYVNKKLPKGDPGFVDISGSVELSSLRNVMTGDNSETNKRRKFEEVIGSIFLSYVNDRVDFNQKFENLVIRDLIVEEFWRD